VSHFAVSEAEGAGVVDSLRSEAQSLLASGVESSLEMRRRFVLRCRRKRRSVTGVVVD
jgi:hypothetical protein